MRKGADSELPGWQPKEKASQLPQERGTLETAWWHQCAKGRGPKDPGVRKPFWLKPFWLKPFPRAGPQIQGSRRPRDVQSERPKPKAQNVPDRGSRNPDEIVTEARTRVSKLEAAIVALGEGDPAVPSLKESLRQARLQAKVLPVEDRIEGTKLFIERSKQRVGALREEVSRAQLIVQETETKLVSEENALRDGELRLQTLEREAHGTPAPPLTAPADFAQELAQVRFCVQELTRGEGRSPIRIVEAWFGREAEEDQIGCRSTSRSHAWRYACGVHQSEQSWRHIEFDGDVDRQGRCRVFREIQSPFQPDVMGLGADTFCLVRCSRYGLRGVRIGEASHPGPPRLVLRGVIPSQGEVSARDVVDLPTTVPASQSLAPEEPSTAPPTFRGLDDGRHEQSFLHGEF